MLHMTFSILILNQLDGAQRIFMTRPKKLPYFWYFLKEYKFFEIFKVWIRANVLEQNLFKNVSKGRIFLRQTQIQTIYVDNDKILKHYVQSFYEILIKLSFLFLFEYRIKQLRSVNFTIYRNSRAFLRWKKLRRKLPEFWKIIQIIQIFVFLISSSL